MSMWHCNEHGFTGPQPCCNKAVRSSMGLQDNDSANQNPIDHQTTTKVSEEIWGTITQRQLTSKLISTIEKSVNLLAEARWKRSWNMVDRVHTGLESVLRDWREGHSG